MVLEHVAKRADLVVVAAAPLHPDRFGHGRLHMVDEVSVPDRLENAVGEAERQDVLDGLFAQVMIDAEHLRLAEHGTDGVVEVPRRLQIHTERLLDDQTHEGVLRAPLMQPRLAELRRDVLEQLGGCREIEQAVALRAVPDVDLL